MRFNNKNVILPEPAIEYLCFEAIEAGNIIFKAPNGFSQYLSEPNVEYSFDKSSWTTLHINDTVNLAVGDKIYFRGENPNGFSYGRGADGSGATSYWNVLMFSAKYNVSGNIMTLIDKIGETTTIPNAYCFFRLFSNDAATAVIPNKSKIVSAKNLSLPATKLKRNCYNNMFNDNDELLYAPTILPATTLTTACYSNMFMRDYKLLESPILPATTLVDQCYYGMFYNCSVLNKVTCYATSGINTNDSTKSWLQNVSATGDFYKASGSSWPSGIAGIPSGWTVHTSL